MVMPCSRSASSPSTSSAKSMSSPVRAVLAASRARASRAGRRRSAWCRRAAGRSASTCRRRPSRRSGSAAGSCPCCGRTSALARRTTCVPSEISLALLLLHRGGLVAVDQAALALARCAAAASRATIVVERRRRRTRSRRSADSSRACGTAPCASRGFSPGSSGRRSSSTMISVPSRSTTGRGFGEVERHDRDVLEPGCIARCRARSSSTAGRRGSSRPCAIRVL